MTKLELRNEWATRVTDFRASGQNAANWCSTNNLKLPHACTAILHYIDTGEIIPAYIFVAILSSSGVYSA